MTTATDIHPEMPRWVYLDAPVAALIANSSIRVGNPDQTITEIFYGRTGDGSGDTIVTSDDISFVRNGDDWVASYVPGHLGYAGPDESVELFPNGKLPAWCTVGTLVEQITLDGSYLSGNRVTEVNARYVTLENGNQFLVGEGLIRHSVSGDEVIVPLGDNEAVARVIMFNQLPVFRSLRRAVDRLTEDPSSAELADRVAELSQKYARMLTRIGH